MELLPDKLDFSTQHVNEEQKSLLGVGVKCLDHGHVYLVDVLGNDDAIAEAARTSYGKGTKKVADNEKLVRYLIRHAHTSPLEMCEMKFRIKLPIFVMRQLIRHRTCSINETSLRYSEAIDESYLPDLQWITSQDPDNRQGGTSSIIKNAQDFRNKMKSEQIDIRDNYNKYLEDGMRRELARINLPVSQYTECYWKMDLNNLLKTLKLRMDSHSQIEIREFANAIAYFVEQCFPITYKAFIDYILEAKTLSRMEHTIIKGLLEKRTITKEYCQAMGMGDREIKEFSSNFDIEIT